MPEFIKGALDDRPFVLQVLSTNSAIGGPPDIEQNPIFAVPKAEQNTYAGVIRWLTEHVPLLKVAEEEGA